MGADGGHSGLGLIKILLIFPLAVEGSGGGGGGEWGGVFRDHATPTNP